MMPHPAAYTTRFAFLSSLAGALTFLIGGTVLVGWGLHLPLLTSGLRGGLTMKPNTAFCFVLLGLSLFLPQPGWSPLHRRRFVQVASVIVVLIGLLTMFEQLSAIDLGIDQALFDEPPGVSAGPHPGRMTPQTSIPFILLGFALLWLDAEPRRSWPVAQLLALGAGAFGLMGLFGYLYGSWLLLGRTVAFVLMSLPSAIAFVLVCTGVLLARPDRGVAELLSSDGPGGTAARVFLPVVIALPMAMDYAATFLVRAGHLGRGTASALDGLVTITIFVTLVLSISSALDRAERTRRQAAAERERLLVERETAMAQVKILSGMISICASCKKIHRDTGAWQAIESYVHEHSEAEFSHGICPDCFARLYPDVPVDGSTRAGADDSGESPASKPAAGE